ncbi:MAG: hypothetical protein RR382_00340 [Tannerellaceae bacterium]
MDAIDAQIKLLRSRGMVVERDGNTTIIKSAPPLETDLVKVFGGHCDCWFEGCEELRNAYKREVEAAEEKGCSGCAKNSIIEGLRPTATAFLLDHYAKHKTTNTQHPGVTEIPRPTGSLQQGDGETVVLQCEQEECDHEVHQDGGTEERNSTTQPTWGQILKLIMKKTISFRKKSP